MVKKIDSVNLGRTIILGRGKESESALQKLAAKAIDMKLEQLKSAQLNQNHNTVLQKAIKNNKK